MNTAKAGFEKAASGIRKVLAAAVLVGMSCAQASVLQFNPSGTGPNSATAVTSAIDVHGSGFVMSQQDPTNPLHFIFSEQGAYQLTAADGVSPIGARDITLTYSVTGTINPMTGALSFSNGAFNLYSDVAMNFGTGNIRPDVVFGASDGALIASFLISAGSGFASGSVHMQGRAATGSILPGYFFSDIGEDLSQSGDLQFAVDIHNQIDWAPSATVVSELVCKASAFPGPGCNGMDYVNTPYYFVVSDGGEVALFTALPEPAGAVLVFAGLVGVGLVSRRWRRQPLPVQTSR